MIRVGVIFVSSALAAVLQADTFVLAAKNNGGKKLRTIDSVTQNRAPSRGLKSTLGLLALMAAPVHGILKYTRKTMHMFNQKNENLLANSLYIFFS